MKKRIIKQMLFDLAEPALRVLPSATDIDGNQLRELWQQRWEESLSESEGDLVKLADAACEELKMLILVTLMEAERY